MWVILTTLIFLPGFCLANLMSFRQMALILAVPLSLLLYVTIALSLYGIDKTSWILPGYASITVALVVISIRSAKAKRNLGEARYELILFLPILFSVVVYNLITGAFVDFGVDAYRHMVYVQQAIEEIKNNGGPKISLTVGYNNLLFHNIAAIFAVQLNVTTPLLIEITSLSYSLLWTFSIYSFSLLVFGRSDFSRRQVFCLTYLAVMFYWFTFGINNFSFPRYYYGGPVILNYSIYLAALWLCLNQLKEKISLRDSLTAFLLVSLAGLLHQQEVLLLIIFIMVLSIVVFVYKIIGVRKTTDIPINTFNFAGSFLVLIACAVGIFLLIYRLPKYYDDPISLLNLGVFSPSLQAWNILRPDHQFYTVLGVWGLYVYAVSVIYIKQLFHRVIFLVTLVSPVFTVFNPIFVEAFAKLTYPQVLWRVLFILQLPLIASYLVGVVLFNLQFEKKKWVSALKVASICPLFILLFPVKVGSFDNSMVKTPSLTQTPDKNSYRQWEDLIGFLDNLESSYQILTDPATGYAIRSLTHHKHDGFKFFPTNSKQFNFESYEGHPLKEYKNSLLVVNLRNGDINQRLKPPHHIYPDVMVVDKHYGQPLIDELENNSNGYLKIWSQDRISVYKVQ